jgi:large subunit ribosomal protein L20
MARVKRGVAARRHKKRFLREAKGFRGHRRNLIRSARETLEKGWNYAYRDRRKRKGVFRRLWIVRINAAARENGLSYSRFINGLSNAGVALDRKVLADIAIADKDGFTRLAQIAKENASALQ